MRAMAWRGPGALEPVDLDDPAPAPGQAVVQVTVCGICGSDLHAHAHGYGIRSGQVLGHEFCGRLVEAPGVEGLAPGQRVVVRPAIPCCRCGACRSGDLQGCGAPVGRFIGFGEPGGFAERVLVPVAVAGETVFPLPDAVDDRAGALVEPLAIALHAIRVAGDVSGRTALVLGGGMIGLGVVRLLRWAGAATIVVAEPSPLRRERALDLGADVVVDPLQDDAVAALAAVTGPWAYGRGARADAVFECAGAPGTFRTALEAAAQGGTVVVAAMGSVRADLRPDLLVTKALTVRGALTYRHEFPEVIDLLADGTIDPGAFVSHTVPLERLDEGFATQRDAGASLKVLVRC